MEIEKHQRIGIKAFLAKATGIGVWNYSDVKSAFDNVSINKFQSGKGSWEIASKDPVRDYSVIYRKNNIIYSSLRWEALAKGMQDIFYLEMYGRRHGENRATVLANNVLSNKMTLGEWEAIKLNLLDIQ